MDAIPSALGKYRLVEEIGRGAMGVVYLGHDPFVNRPVALKVARRDGGDGAARSETLFFNEARAAGMLRHPSIVGVYDAGAEGPWFYIAMEYVAGQRSLDAHCHRASLLPPARVAEIVFECAEALDYAHRKGVVHRDVKPSNILLTETGAVKVADFGVALLVDPRVLDTQLMGPAGSPMYMSPEQIREEAVTNRSDLFSLGAVMYEMLTGVQPFSGDTLAAVTHRVLEETPPRVSRLRPGVPPSLEAIVERALAKRAADRYGSAWDLAADLGRVFTELERPRDGIAAEGRADALKRLDFFRGFDDAAIWELLRWARWQELAPGEVVIAEDEEGDSVYVVVSGRVEVRKGARRVATLGPGQCVGEIAYLNRRRRTATVAAAEPASVLRIRAAELDRASESCQIQFQRVFIATLIERLVDTTEALAASD